MPFATLEKRRAWQRANRPHLRAYARAHYAKDPEPAKAAERERHRQNPARKRAQAKQWATDNPERKRDWHRRNHLLKTFGITPEQYDELLAKQGGGCGICGAPKHDSTGRRLAVDHDHATRQVRGLLCKACNTAIGLLEEDAERMAKAIAYLKRGGT